MHILHLNHPWQYTFSFSHLLIQVLLLFFSVSLNCLETCLQISEESAYSVKYGADYRVAHSTQG